MKTKQKIQRQINHLREQLERMEAPKRLRANLALVGKCFKYQNSYGHGKEWLLYSRVVEADADGIQAFQFQDDLQGRMEITKKTWMMIVMSGYVPISESEFYTAWLQFKKNIPTPI